jgi:hypothetical protein
MFIVAAGNVVVPAYLAIVSKGYAVQRADKGSGLTAKKGGAIYAADDPVTLLGLIAIGETRGEQWKATDAEIDAYLLQFGA